MKEILNTKAKISEVEARKKREKLVKWKGGFLKGSYN